MSAPFLVKLTRQLGALSCAGIFASLIVASFALAIYLDLTVLAMGQWHVDLPPGAFALAGTITSDLRTFGASIWIILCGSTTTLVFGSALGAGPMALAWGASINLCLSVFGTAYLLGA